MMRRTAGRRAIIARILAMSAAIVPAHAATQSVTVSSNTYSPASRQVAAGDTILWVWSQGPHNVTAYSGASFASGNRNTNATYTQVFGGGVVRYRCTLHSTLVGGECDGMCGLINEKPADFTPPLISIDSPRSGQTLTPTPRVQGGVVNPVVVDGQASDTVGVLGVLFRIYDTAGRPQEQPASCTGCVDTSVQWRVELNLLPGSYVAEARASDTSGNTQWSTRISFVVL